MTKSKQFLLIAGPCAVENELMCMNIAEKVKRIAEKFQLDFVFKGSYRKANRSKINSFTGIGDQKALKILAKVKKEFNLMVTTDIHTPNEAAIAAEFVDVLQIPAFLCRQTDLLLEAAKTNKVVSIKKGQFMAPQAMKFAVDKVKSVGNNKIMLIERGNCFGYSDLVVDFRGIPQMQAFDVPVVLDCTHSLQQPNQSTGVTGGLPHLIETIAKAGTAVGVDGLFIETHPEPFKALSDGANMLPLDKLEPLIEKIMRIRMAIEL